MPSCALTTRQTVMTPRSPTYDCQERKRPCVCGINTHHILKTHTRSVAVQFQQEPGPLWVKHVVCLFVCLKHRHNRVCVCVWERSQRSCFAAKHGYFCPSPIICFCHPSIFHFYTQLQMLKKWNIKLQKLACFCSLAVSKQPCPSSLSLALFCCMAGTYCKYANASVVTRPMHCKSAFILYIVNRGGTQWGDKCSLQTSIPQTSYYLDLRL